jgi:hypothetical protein
MAAKILDSRLQLTVVDGGAVPGVFVNPIGHVIVHLTQGFDAASFPRDQGKALTAGAHVPLGSGPDGTTFAFVQIGRANFMGAFYAGRIPSEGSIGVLAHVPPALPNPVMLDASGTPPLPWFEDPTRSTFVPPVMNSTWGDHPASRVPSKLRNSFASNVDNFLFHLIDDRDFWTIFTAQDPGGALRYIAHFRWQVRYDVQFMWRDDKAIPRTIKSFFKMHERNTRGRPIEPEIQALLTSPAGPRASVAFGNALTQAFLGARGPNRSENPRWFPAVPPDFWG